MDSKSQYSGGSVTGRYCFLFLVMFLVYRSDAYDVLLVFKDSVTVRDSLIRLGDIADVHCPDLKMVESVKTMIAGGAAPPGYSRLVNIADLMMYRVKPYFAGTTITANNKKRITVKTYANRFTVRQMYHTVSSYLDSALSWKSGEWSFDLINDTLGWNGYPGSFNCSVGGLQSGFAKGKVILTLHFTQGVRLTRIPVPLIIHVQVPVLVALKDIGRGNSFSYDNIVLEGMDITGFGPEPFTDFSELNDHFATMTIKAGTILQKRMVQKQPDVFRGESIVITYNKGRVKCTVQGTARESGSTGDKIWVENWVTKRILRTIVIGKGRVTLV